MGIEWGKLNRKRTGVALAALLAAAVPSSVTDPATEPIAHRGGGTPPVEAVRPDEKNFHLRNVAGGRDADGASTSDPRRQAAGNGGGNEGGADDGHADGQVVSALGRSGIPQVALRAYGVAQATLAEQDPTCQLDWALVAAIGRVESNHGRYGGAQLMANGYGTRPIRGIPLDGRPGVATIRDTDDGGFDGDTVYDRAVGPMQFIPSSWGRVAVDANADGRADPNNIFDAAAAAGVYLCAYDTNVRDPQGRWNAVYRYNHSAEYVETVLALAAEYAQGHVPGPPAATPPADTPLPEPTAPLPPASVTPPPLTVDEVADRDAGAPVVPSPGSGTPPTTTPGTTTPTTVPTTDTTVPTTDTTAPPSTDTTVPTTDTTAPPSTDTTVPTTDTTAPSTTDTTAPVDTGTTTGSTDITTAAAADSGV